jgi:DNA polymerase-4
MRWFFHIDMDAFYASVEQALNPALRGKPVIVGGRSGHGVVTSASYEARKFGVRSAMPGFQAKKLCPRGIFLPGRHRVYAEFSEQVFRILEQYSPEVHAVSIDEGLLDLTGTERLLGGPLKTADEIIRRIEVDLALPSSGGLATNRVLAKIAATLAKPHGLIYVPADCELDFLSPLPVELIPGVGPKTRKSLAEIGIKTIRELIRSPELAARYLDFGGASERRRHHDHSIGNETTLEHAVTDHREMEKILWELIEEVGGRLRRQRLYARCLTLKIRYSNFLTITRSRTLATPTHFDREMFAVASELLRKNVLPGKAVRLLGLSASSLQRSGWQEPLFKYEQRKSWDKLYRGIDELRKKYGENTIGSATPRNRAS